MNEEENTKQPEITEGSQQQEKIISEEMAMPEKEVITLPITNPKHIIAHFILPTATKPAQYPTRTS